MPLISVIIPAYNAEKTIEDTVKSVLNQSFSDFELIVINDGSQDATLDILSKIKDSRLKVFTHSNSGPQVSRNRGIKEATGQYISFLDADDLWTSDKLESQFDALQSHPTAAVAYSWTNWVDETGKFFRRGSYISANGDVFARLLLMDFIESGSNPLILRQALEAAGGFDETLPAAQDWDMWLRLAAHNHFVAVPSVQILYRTSPNSWSANVCRMEAASLRVIEQACAKAPEFVKRLKKDILANRYIGLTVKTLDGHPTRERGWLAARFIRSAIRHKPSLLKARVLLKVWFKITAMILLPSEQAQQLFKTSKGVSNVNALLGYLRLDVS
jgi:glycosyltransferase involved in cell wall biosynthesis